MPIIIYKLTLKRNYAIDAGHDVVARALHSEVIAQCKKIGWICPTFEQLI